MEFKLKGIQEAFVLLGGPGSFSPQHYEDKKLVTN